MDRCTLLISPPYLYVMRCETSKGQNYIKCVTFGWLLVRWFKSIRIQRQRTMQRHNKRIVY